MGSRAVLQEQQLNGGQVHHKNNGQIARRNRTALGDIGNLVTVRGANANGVVKPQQINRPVTRSFCAQLLANAQAVAEKNKKQGVQVVDVKQIAEKKVQEKKKTEVVVDQIAETPLTRQSSDQKQCSKKKKSSTLTSFLTAHSKEAGGMGRKSGELIVNIDENSTKDELAVVEYVEDIYKFYEVAEDESRVKEYMGKQPDLNEKMRAILVDWLIEVHYKFELRLETLYLTVYIIDRFLSMKVVPRKELQLVGISSMLIACKYEEIWAPEVNDFVQISDKAYVREQVLAMEKAILGSLEWYLTVPTPYMFLTRYVKASISADSEMENMVYFFAELGIMSYSVAVKYPPSMLAASSVYAARCTLNSTPFWTETLKHYTGYAEDEIIECARLLVGFHQAAPENRLRAVYKKFLKPDNGSVALWNPAKNLLALTHVI